MRLSLLYNPRIVLERLALTSQRLRRFARLRGTPAAALSLGHIDSLELLALLRPQTPAVIYDIGASSGTWTCLAKSLYPAARVEAFAPRAQPIADFHRWTAAWPDDIHLHRCALGSTERIATMHVMDFSDASSLLPLAEAGAREFNLHPTQEQSVRLIPLDVLVRRENLPPPDLIKLDIQGYELEALRGAVGCLRTARSVLCEVSFREFYTGQPSFAELAVFLDAHGFSLRALGAGTTLGAPLVQADALFTKD